nr:FAD-dependent thymidylate synthase [bacterium]
MEIHLAGMNIDHSLLHDMESMLHDAADALARNPADHQKNTELVEKLSRHLASDTITPETISAAYARISRDPRSVDQLRQEALQRVGKARRSNRNIIFGMGHSSVAEHAVFNLDIIGITRLLSEYIQSHRLCSFTEKSQRYIRLETDYIIPPEIRNTSLAKDYETFTRNRFRDYNELCRIICEDPSRDPSLAGEDARYILPLSVTTQMGMTINARTLERLLQRAASSNLQEFREFGKRLFSVIDGIAPSVIKYTEGNRREVDRAAVLSQRVAAVS